VLRKFKYFLVAISCVLFVQLKSTHIVGGELSYDYLWPGTYRVTLKLYVDCSSQHVDTSSTAMVNVWNKYMTDIITQINLGSPVISNVSPSTNNPCMQTPVGICVERAVYTKTVTLPSSPGGYVLRYESCCRNANIADLNSPLTQGVAYFSYIPDVDSVGVNSSPHFNSYPSLYVCQGQQLGYNHAATDVDGDSLVYSLCPAYRGGVTQTVVNTVDYLAPYAYSYPMASSPTVGINPQNGFLYGVPNLIGKWVICIQVAEYRSGKLLSKHFRDYQYNVINCNVVADAGFADQVKKCNDFAITFQNQSFSNFGMTYDWNFGVTNTGADTSHLKDPTYIYSPTDTGKHVVTLVINKGLPCVDSVKKIYYIYPKFDVQFHIPPGLQCIKNNTLNFNVGGVYDASAKFYATFGGSATPNTSTLSSTNVTFNNGGAHNIKMWGTQYICRDSAEAVIIVYDRPKPQVDNLPATLCDPGTLKFANTSISEYTCNYVWTVNGVNSYYVPEPTHVFSPPGMHSVMLTIYRDGVCPDTIVSPAYQVTVYPSPVADFVISPSVTSIFEPEVEFESMALGNISYMNYDFGDGVISPNPNQKHRYIYPGTYKVSQTVVNDYECERVVVKEVIVTPEFRFWVPNVFTPTEDGLNDVFKPVTYGLTDYKMEIFSRGGQKLFTSYDLDKGWDGMYKGQPCKQDVYVWKINYLNELTNKPATKTGYVTLLNQQ
jgi:gliding motility-associated-like protein